MKIKKNKERGSERIRNKKKNLGGEEKERKNKGNRDYGERYLYIKYKEAEREGMRFKALMGNDNTLVQVWTDIQILNFF